jgi:microcystin-dependent protein
MDPFLGEIRAVGFGFAPVGWALCDGSLLPISRNTALYSLLGNTYGGDGKTTFSLPDLRGRAVVNAGTGAGLSSYALGAVAGQEMVTLTVAQLPAHAHALGNLNINPADPSSLSPTGSYLSNSTQLQYGETASETMAAGSVTGTGAPVGDNQPHSNLQPYLALYYVIALQGIYPPRP